MPMQYIEYSMYHRRDLITWRVICALTIFEQVIFHLFVESLFWFCFTNFYGALNLRWNTLLSMYMSVISSKKCTHQLYHNVRSITYLIFVTCIQILCTSKFCASHTTYFC
jgi:hypothetical protein